MNCKWLILLLSLAGAQAADKDRPKFSTGPISGYEFRQTIQDVTIAAHPYDKEELAKQAFGKLNPYKHGVLPVLVIVENGSGKALNLDGMNFEFITPDRERVEATPASDIKYISAPQGPKMGYPRIPGRGPSVRKNKDLDSWEIEGRAFAAKMLPPKETASGFVYFQAPHRLGSKLYITGIREAATGNELFYFEIPLDPLAAQQ